MNRGIGRVCHMEIKEVDIRIILWAFKPTTSKHKTRTFFFIAHSLRFVSIADHHSGILLRGEKKTQADSLNRHKQLV